MDCPYLLQGKTNKNCEAYLYGLMIPSIQEERNYCKSSYILCSYYCSRIKEPLLVKEEEKEVNVEEIAGVI